MELDKHARIICIGLGNNFRQDDGVGLFIINELKRKELPGVVCCEHLRSEIDLIERWKDASRVIIFDAVSSGASPGSLFRFQIPPEEIPRNVFSCSTHACSVADAVHLGKILNQLPAELILYGIEGKLFGHGIGLTPEVKEAALTLVENFPREVLS